MGDPAARSDASSVRRASAWAGPAGVAVSLGLTELFAGFFSTVPSAISAIGSYVIDRSPGWLKDFAIAAFGTADKAVLAVSIVIVALLPLGVWLVRGELWEVLASIALAALVMIRHLGNIKRLITRREHALT